MTNNLRYDYVGDPRLLEGADWIGCRPDGLRLHYHDEVQVSLIWNGVRDFQIGRRCLRLKPGQLLVIPHGRPHHAMPSTDGVQSAEFYFAPDALPDSIRRILVTFDYVVASAPSLLEAMPFDVSDTVIARMTTSELKWQGPPMAQQSPGAALLGALQAHDGASEAAVACGLSREGFIRAFTRTFGMTPHAFRINTRLNLCRQQLRDGASISDVAYASGFSDQSHFGRLFLQFFGATPGQFRAAHMIC